MPTFFGSLSSAAKSTTAPSLCEISGTVSSGQAAVIFSGDDGGGGVEAGGIQDC